MTDTPRAIYRRHPDHAGNAPTMKIVIRAGSPMRTIDPKRLVHAGSLSSISVRRRALSKRTVILSLLLVLLVVAALVATSEGRAHGQTNIGEPAFIDRIIAEREARNFRNMGRCENNPNDLI